MLEAQNLNFGRGAPVRARWTTGPVRPWEGAKWGTELFWEPSGIHPFVHSKRNPSTPGYQALYEGGYRLYRSRFDINIHYEQ